MIDAGSGDTIRYQIYGMARDRTGKVWFGYPGEGLRVYDPARDTVAHFEIKTEAGRRNTRPMRMLEDRRGYLWIAGYAEIWRISPDRDRMERFDARSAGTQALLSDGLWSIFEDRSGLIWFGSPFRKALYYDPRRETFRFYPAGVAAGTGSPPAWVYCLQQDQQGRIWYGSEEAFYRYDPDTGERRTYPKRGFLYNLLVDRAGLIWLCTEEGLFRFDPVTERSTPILTTETTGVEVRNVLYAAFDGDGDLWVTTWDYGLFHLERAVFDHREPSVPMAFEHWSWSADPQPVQLPAHQRSAQGNGGQPGEYLGVRPPRRDHADRKSFRANYRIQLSTGQGRDDLQ